MSLVTFIIWNGIGAVITVFIAIGAKAEGFELCNPRWVYRYNKSVNWFGAYVLAIGYTLLCPIVAVGYWFYKLCTVGR
jgi:hypothetical protein